MEYKNISTGMIYRLNQGEWCGTMPMGFERIFGPKRKKYGSNSEVKINEKNKAIVIDLFERYGKGDISQKSLIKYIQQKYGITLAHNTIFNILKNKFYIGIMVWKNIEYPHKYGSFVSQELFDKVQEIKKYNKKHSKYIDHNFSEYTDTTNSNGHFQETIQDRLINFCLSSKSLSEIITHIKSNVETEDEIKNILFDLEMQNKIIEIQPRIYKSH